MLNNNDDNEHLYLVFYVKGMALVLHYSEIIFGYIVIIIVVIFCILILLRVVIRKV